MKILAEGLNVEMKSWTPINAVYSLWEGRNDELEFIK